MKKIRILSFLLFVSLMHAMPAASETIAFKASRMTGNAGENRQNTVLSGNAWIKTEDMEISAETITLSGKDYNQVVAEGSVSGTDSSSGFSFSCGKLVFNRDTGVARLQNEVKLDDSRNGVKAEAGIIEYDRNSEIVILQIGVRLQQKQSLCTSAFALYRQNEQMLEMTGNPVVVRDNDTFRAQTILFNLDTQEITLDGRVSGTVTEGGR